MRRLMRSVSSWLRAARWDSRTLPRSKPPRDRSRPAIEAAPDLDPTTTIEAAPRSNRPRDRSHPRFGPNENRCACSCSRSPRTGVLVLVPPSLSPTCSCAKNRCCS
uniref:Uncharacterized protein n=1 Tax=Fagus sylvatica TaxID=28930 RepID=A0A2N9HMA5_FAGSY